MVCKPKRYLYDILEDPYQENTLDLEDEGNKALAKELEEKIINWMKCQNDGFIDNWSREAAYE